MVKSLVKDSISTERFFSGKGKEGKVKPFIFLGRQAKLSFQLQDLCSRKIVSKKFLPTFSSSLDSLETRAFDWPRFN